MSKIVVLTTTYLNRPYANGVCARYIVRALRSLGHTVNVVCFADDSIPDDEIGQVYCVPKPRKSVGWQKMGLLRKVDRMIKAIISPRMNNALVDCYVAATKECLRANHSDVVISMFFPIEGPEALKRIKRTEPGIITIVYELDSIGDGISNSIMQSLQNRSYERWLKKVYRQIDRIIIMKSHKSYWEKTFGKNFQKKLLVADLPVLVQHNAVHADTNESIKMVYSGRIDSTYRSPKYLLSVLSELNKRLDYDFRFYSEGDCETEISLAAQQNCKIHQCGYICQNELELALARADFLVNLGNKTSHNVPSKLVLYLSYGKPIIHFSSQKEDICRHYLEEYPLSLIIDESMDKGEAARKVRDFVLSTKGKRVPFASVESIYRENCPSYSAELITSII